MATRLEIRNALKALYEGIDGVVSVFVGRQRSVDQRDMPAVCIYFEGEEKELAHINKPREFIRTAAVSSEIHVQGADALVVEQELDELCRKREEAILADETLGGLVDLILPASDEYDIDHTGQHVGGVAKCGDSVTY